MAAKCSSTMPDNYAIPRNSVTAERWYGATTPHAIKGTRV